MDEFNIEEQVYTPPKYYNTDYNMYSGIGSLENINQASAIQDEYYADKSSLAGWLNAVSNIVPAVKSVADLIFGKTESSGLAQTTKSVGSNPVSNGLVKQATQGNIISGAQEKSSNMFLYLLIGGGLILFLFLKR